VLSWVRGVWGKNSHCVSHASFIRDLTHSSRHILTRSSFPIHSPSSCFVSSSCFVFSSAFRTSANGSANRYPSVRLASLIRSSIGKNRSSRFVSEVSSLRVVLNPESVVGEDLERVVRRDARSGIIRNKGSTGVNSKRDPSIKICKLCFDRREMRRTYLIRLSDQETTTSLHSAPPSVPPVIHLSVVSRWAFAVACKEGTTTAGLRIISTEFRVT
jgi:hypothetical protein